jgi:hypothetical protein
MLPVPLATSLYLHPSQTPTLVLLASLALIKNLVPTRLQHAIAAPPVIQHQELVVSPPQLVLFALLATLVLHVLHV